jgi:hypothetical protein
MHPKRRPNEDDDSEAGAYALLCLLVSQSFDGNEALVNMLSTLVLQAFTKGYDAGKAAASA